MAMIEIDRLTHDYRRGERSADRPPALHDITLTVERGEILAIVGGNGAGKSTLFGILAGLVRPTMGTVRIGIEGYASDQVEWKRELGYVTEQPLLAEWLTPQESLVAAARLTGFERAEARQIADRVLVRVGLVGIAHQRMRGLSKGTRQRIALAHAIVHEPTLLLLDEPTSGLDLPGRSLVRTLLKDARRAGQTVLFSTHTLSDAEEVADRIAVLDRGRLVALASLEEILCPVEDGALEVVVSGLSPGELPPVVGLVGEVVARSGRLHLRLASEELLSPLLDSVWKRKGNLVSVGRSRPSLEGWIEQQLRGQSLPASPSSSFLVPPFPS
jgi:ABC-type multidrug transport system ATPase subunit